MTNQLKLASTHQPASSVVVAQHAVPALRGWHVASQCPPAATLVSPATEVSLWSQLNLEGAKPQHGLLESFHLSSSQAPAWVSQHA